MGRTAAHICGPQIAFRCEDNGVAMEGWVTVSALVRVGRGGLGGGKDACEKDASEDGQRSQTRMNRHSHSSISTGCNGKDGRVAQEPGRPRPVCKYVQAR